MARPAARIATALAALLALPGLAGAGSTATLEPTVPDSGQVLYTQSRVGFAHFVRDELPGLVAGQAWDWQGRHYEVVKLHRIVSTTTSQAHQANRNYDSPHRGWAVAVLHVRVDGRLLRARVEANASYVWQPGGWAWEQVLLYLGEDDSWDFVKREMV